jgi:hypothetical protein
MHGAPPLDSELVIPVDVDDALLASLLLLPASDWLQPGTAPQQRLQLFRCLDGTHTRPCAGCSPAPDAADVDDFELVGERGERNGEKLLRSLLSQKREWRARAERERTARLCDARAAAGGGDDAAALVALAAALRAQRTGGLTKRQMLFLARAWGYGCHLWQRHGRASRRRAEEEAVIAVRSVRRSVVQLPTSGVIAPGGAEARLLGGGYCWDAAHGDDLQRLVASPAVAAAEVDAALHPLACAAATMLAGAAAREAAAAAGAPYFCAADAVQVLRAAAFFAASARAWHTAAVAPAARSGAAADGNMPAWHALAGRSTAVEAQLLALRDTLRLWANNNCARRFFECPATLDALRSGLLDEHTLLLAAQQHMPAEDAQEGEVAAAAAAVAAAHAAHAASADGSPDASDALAAAPRATWLAEMYRALTAMAELCVRSQALLGDAKLARAAAFEATQALVAAAMATFTQQAADALRSRAAWMEELLQQAGDDDGAAGAAQRLLFQFGALA